MNDMINSLISENITIITLIIVLIVIIFFNKFVIRLVDSYLTLRKLKITFFVLIFFLIILVFGNSLKILYIEAKMIAAYMIGLSALLASTVGLINMRKNDIKNVLDKSEKIIGITNLGMTKIKVFLDKSKLLKLMLTAKMHTNVEILVEYEIILRDLLDYLNTEDLQRYIDDNSQDAFYRLHNDLFLILAKIKKEINSLNINYENDNNTLRNVFSEKTLSSYESLISNAEIFLDVIKKIRNEKSLAHVQLYNEEIK